MRLFPVSEMKISPLSSAVTPGRFRLRRWRRSHAGNAATPFQRRRDHPLRPLCGCVVVRVRDIEIAGTVTRSVATELRQVAAAHRRPPGIVASTCHQPRRPLRMRCASPHTRRPLSMHSRERYSSLGRGKPSGVCAGAISQHGPDSAMVPPLDAVGSRIRTFPEALRLRHGIIRGRAAASLPAAMPFRFQQRGDEPAELLSGRAPCRCRDQQVSALSSETADD